MGQYFYLDGTTPVGPFSLQDVYTLIDRKVVGPATVVCKENGTEWQELQSPRSGKHRRRDRINVTAVIIAFLLSAVAIYITYMVSHTFQDSGQNTQEMDRLLGR